MLILNLKHDVSCGAFALDFLFLLKGALFLETIFRLVAAVHAFNSALVQFFDFNLLRRVPSLVVVENGGGSRIAKNEDRPGGHKQVKQLFQVNVGEVTRFVIGDVEAKCCWVANGASEVQKIVALLALF